MQVSKVWDKKSNSLVRYSWVTFWIQSEQASFLIYYLMPLNLLKKETLSPRKFMVKATTKMR
ncbi:MAG TPA: hypothetical protein VFY41_02755 [Nitrososphaeraceae archaeon]|nr:hypothetical protein [Nitrososphaeraceae archaeon]